MSASQEKKDQMPESSRSSPTFSPSSVMEGTSAFDHINKELKEKNIRQETPPLEQQSRLYPSSPISGASIEIQKIQLKNSIHRYSDAKLTSPVSSQLPKSSYAVQEETAQSNNNANVTNMPKNKSPIYSGSVTLSPLLSARLQEYQKPSSQAQPEVVSLQSKFKESSARSKSMSINIINSGNNNCSPSAQSSNRHASAPAIQNPLHPNNSTSALPKDISEIPKESSATSKLLPQQQRIKQSAITPLTSIQNNGSDESAWSGGKELIEAFGHESPNQKQETAASSRSAPPFQKLSASANLGMEEQEHSTTCYHEISVEDSNDSPLRQVSNARTVIYNPVTEAFVNDYMNSATATSTDNVSVAAISSKRGSTSRTNWRYGADMDDTPNSLRNMSGQGSVFSKTNNRNSMLPNQDIQQSHFDRYNNAKYKDKRESIVTFTDEEQPQNNIQPNPNEYQGKKGNDWKYVLVTLGLIVGAVFIYTLVFTISKSVGPQSTIYSSDELYDYIHGLNTTDRQKIFKTLSYLYRDDFRNLNSTNSNTIVYKEPIPPRVNVTVGATGINTFQGISSKYKGDYEIKELMVDDSLNQAMFGMTYAPKNVIEPMCGVTQREVLLDIARMSTITSRIRTYGTHCDQGEFILNSFKELNLNMTLSLGVWISGDDYNNWRQMNSLKKLLSTYPRKYFDSIYIGNEVLFREELNDTELIQFVHEAKRYVNSLGYFDLPVGTSETGAKITDKLIKAVDFIGVNIHPFFGGVSSKNSVDWVFDFLDHQVVPFRDLYNKECSIVISEIGWPYDGGQFMDAKATSNDYQNFLDKWICNKKSEDYQWYYFEAFDEPWKKVWYDKENKWETEWGFFTHHRNIKDSVYLPVCED